jgi:CRISPR-associated protein Cmr5
MAQTLEQQRAADAWAKSADAWAKGKDWKDDYVSAAKGLPALIMNSGLMQVLAYLEDKGGAKGRLGAHLREWLQQRFKDCFKDFPKAEFAPMMQTLLTLDARTFQNVTAEALAWLRWMRQIAPARSDSRD